MGMDPYLVRYGHIPDCPGDLRQGFGWGALEIDVGDCAYIVGQNLDSLVAQLGTECL